MKHRSIGLSGRTSWLESGAPNNGNIVGKGDPWEEAFVLDHIGTSWRGFIRTTDNAAWAVGWPLTIETWTHLAFTWDGSTEHLYVNGALVSSQDVSSIRASGSFLGIGLRSESGYPDEELDLEFKGKIEEVEYFNRALSAAEIAAIYNAGSAGKCKCSAIFDSATGDPILDDPAIQAALLESLLKSEAYNPDIEERLEHPGYFYQRPDGSLYGKLKPNPPLQTGCSGAPAAPIPDDPADVVIATYHAHPFSHQDTLPVNCHPNKPDEVWTYDAEKYGGPSGEDWSFAQNQGIPVYVIDLDFVYRADPGIPDEEDWADAAVRFAWNQSLCGL